MQALEILWLLWPLTGAAIHAAKCADMKTYCGEPIWQVAGTYMMFFPAMIAGPLLLFVYRD